MEAKRIVSGEVTSAKLYKITCHAQDQDERLGHGKGGRQEREDDRRFYNIHLPPEMAAECKELSHVADNMANVEIGQWRGWQPSPHSHNWTAYAVHAPNLLIRILEQRHASRVLRGQVGRAVHCRPFITSG